MESEEKIREFVPGNIFTRDGILKLLRSLGINFKDWIPPAYVA